MDELFADIRSCAERTLPVVQKGPNSNYSSDPVVKKLVSEKRDLILKVKALSSNDAIAEGKRSVKKIQRAISQRLVEINNAQADVLADEINNTDDARKIFSWF